MNNYVQTLPTCALGEGPHWDEGREELYFVDNNGSNRHVHRFVPSTEEHYRTTVDLGRVSLVVRVEGQPNKFVVAVGKTLQLMEWDGRSSTPTSLTSLYTVDPDNPNTRFNDGKCDSSGRLWVGTLDQSGGTSANLYRVTATDIQTVESGVSISNGIAWNKENTLMFYNDTLPGKVYVFDFNNEEGTISNRRTLFDFNESGEEGSPDGMTIDSDGNLWIACFGGSQVIQIDPATGRKINSISMPTKNITSVAFGEPDLNVLYVTSAIDGNSDEEKLQQPTAGALFKITNTGFKGQSAGNNFRM